MNFPNYVVKYDYSLGEKGGATRAYFEIRGRDYDQFVLLYLPEKLSNRYKGRWIPLKHLIKSQKLKRMSRVMFEGQWSYLFD